MSSILLTPTSGNATQLPIQTSGTIVQDTFVPPYADGSETFTKQGTDVDITKWTGGAVQGQGIVGDSFITNNMGATVDLSAKIPDYITTKFIGVSFWMKIRPNSNTNIIKLLDGVNFSLNIPIELRNQSGDLWLTTRSDLTNSGSIVTGVTHVYQNVTSELTDWTHIFAWVNYNTGAPVLNVSVNGITLTPSTISPGDLPSTDFNQTPATEFKVGGAGVIKGEISNLNWSTNPLFASELYTYYNQPKEYKLFERLSHTGSELFTQDIDGLGNDVPVSNWKGAASQTQGVISKSFSGPNPTTNAYVDLSTKTPTLSATDYFGMSLFVKLKSAADGPSNWLISIGTTTLGNPISNTNIQLHFTTTYDSVILNVQDDTSLNPPNNKLAVEPMTTLVADKWYHIFCSIDLSAGGTIAPEIWVDGINTVLPPSSITNETFPNGFVNSTDIFYVGAANPSNGGAPNTFSGADICNFYWSTNPDFKNHLDKYSNLPTAEIK